MEADLKSRMLRLLKEDEEFRYAVAGYIGLDEILRELRDLRRRSEEHDRKFNEILKELDRHGRRFEEHDKKFNEILKVLDGHGRRLEEHDKKFNEVILELRELRKDVSEIRSYIERTSLTLEEEAREVLQHRLKRAGVAVKLEFLILPELEINIYGASDDLCIVGEVSTRTGTRIVDLLNEKIEKLQRKHPEYLRPRIIKVIYTLWATEEAVEKARQNDIWMVKATGDLTSLKIVGEKS